MEGQHVVGVLFTKDKFLLFVNLCVVLIFMHLFSYVFPLYVVYIYLLLFYINLFICRAFLVNSTVSKFVILVWHCPAWGWGGYICH